MSDIQPELSSEYVTGVTGTSQNIHERVPEIVPAQEKEIIPRVKEGEMYEYW